MSTPNIVTREQWDAAREQLLVQEKEHTRQADDLARRRRELPWVRIEPEYTFQTADSPRTRPTRSNSGGTCFIPVSSPFAIDGTAPSRTTV